MLIPLTVSTSGLHLPVVFAIATGIPVILFAWVIAYTISGMGNIYKRIKSFEYWFRKAVAVLFLGIGVYYVIAVWL
jgi:cytochrome c-type biogenesis protein